MMWKTSTGVHGTQPAQRKAFFLNPHLEGEAESTCNPLKNTTKKEKPKPHVLLIWIQIGAAIMEKSMKVPQKIKNSVSYLYMES